MSTIANLESPNSTNATWTLYTNAVHLDRKRNSRSMPQYSSQKDEHTFHDKKVWKGPSSREARLDLRKPCVKQVPARREENELNCPSKPRLHERKCFPEDIWKIQKTKMTNSKGKMMRQDTLLKKKKEQWKLEKKPRFLEFHVDIRNQMYKWETTWKASFSLCSSWKGRSDER